METLCDLFSAWARTKSIGRSMIDETTLKEWEALANGGNFIRLTSVQYSNQLELRNQAIRQLIAKVRELRTAGTFLD